MKGQAVTVRMARWSAMHPWRAVAVWAAFIGICIAVGMLTGTNQVTGKGLWVGESAHAEQLAAQGGLSLPSTEAVLITARQGNLDISAAEQAAADVSTRMRTLPAVAAVASPVRSSNGNAMLVPITMKGDDKAVISEIPSLLSQTAAAQGAHPDLRIDETGDVSASQGVNELIGHDLSRAEAITLPLTLLILLIVFGSILAAGVPVLLAISSVGAAMGLYAAASYIFPDAGGAVSNVILMIGMAVGVDYSLFYLKRVREEREWAGGEISHATAVELAAATSGRAVLMSGLAVLVSLVGLYLADDVVFSSIATGSILVVSVAMISSLTVLPALLAKLGNKTEPHRIPFLKGRAKQQSKPARVWSALLRPATKHPAITLTVATAAMILLALPAMNLRLSVAGNDIFPKSIPAIDTYDRMIDAFPDQGVAHFIVVHDEQAQPGKLDATLEQLAQRAQNDPLFPKEAKVTTSADGKFGTLQLPTSYGEDSDKAKESLQQLRTQLVPDTVGKLAGADYGVSGILARDVDYVDHQAAKLPWVIGFVLLFTFVTMLIAFRSVLLAVAAIILNLLSAAAAFGILVSVFQYHWAEQLLSFNSSGFISARIPLLLLVVLFGLSMDYQVFVLSRIKEAAQNGATTADAISQGIRSSAGVVTSAAVVMVSVFASFVSVEMIELKQTGFGLAVAVLLDVIVVRILILPALMTLLRKVIWWPARIKQPALDRQETRHEGIASPAGV